MKKCLALLTAFCLWGHTEAVKYSAALANRDVCLVDALYTLDLPKGLSDKTVVDDLQSLLGRQFALSRIRYFTEAQHSCLALSVHVSAAVDSNGTTLYLVRLEAVEAYTLPDGNSGLRALWTDANWGTGTSLPITYLEASMKNLAQNFAEDYVAANP